MAASDKARKLLSLGACSCLLFLAQFAAWARLASGQQDDRKLDHKRLQTVVEGFSRAWNRGDLRALARFFAEEGLLVTPLDRDANRQVVHSRVGSEYEARLRGTRLSAQIAAIDFPTDNIAVLEGNYRITGVQAPPGSAKSVAGPFVFRLERNGNGWKITRARLYRVTEKNLAFRDAHNERYPFVHSAESEALVIADSAKFSERKPAAVQSMNSLGDAGAAEAVQSVAIGR